MDKILTASFRLDEALAQVRSSPYSSAAVFTLHFEPYQLHPDFPDSAEKDEWYLHNKHMDNSDGQAAYKAHMTSLFQPFGIQLNFNGQMGNTLNTHRVIQYFQDKKGPDVANKLVDALYKRYFTEARHPSKDDTLVESCLEAGISEKEAKEVVEDKSKGEKVAKERLRSVAMDVDAVPVVTVEGKRRDMTLTGAKQVVEYIKAMETVIKESS